MPQTKEVEEFLKTIGPFYEIVDSDEEQRSTFTPDDVMDEAANQSSQIESHDPNISADLDITNTGTLHQFNQEFKCGRGSLPLHLNCPNFLKLILHNQTNNQSNPSQCLLRHKCAKGRATEVPSFEV